MVKWGDGSEKKNPMYESGDLGEDEDEGES